MEKTKKINDIIEDIENSEDIKKLPPEMKEIMIGCLKSMNQIPFPVVTFKENDWIIASTPIIDLSAQAKTEKDAVNNLIEMINDYMTDPYTKKPEIKSIINMEIGVKTVNITLPFPNISADSERAVCDG